MKTRSKLNQLKVAKDASQKIVTNDIFEELPSLIEQLTNEEHFSNERGNEAGLENILDSTNVPKNISNSEIIIKKLSNEVNVCFVFIQNNVSTDLF